MRVLVRGPHVHSACAQITASEHAQQHAKHSSTTARLRGVEAGQRRAQDLQEEAGVAQRVVGGVVVGVRVVAVPVQDVVAHLSHSPSGNLRPACYSGYKDSTGDWRLRLVHWLPIKRQLVGHIALLHK